jgi:hypothetical protein
MELQSRNTEARRRERQEIKRKAERAVRKTIETIVRVYEVIRENPQENDQTIASATSTTESLVCIVRELQERRGAA